MRMLFSAVMIGLALTTTAVAEIEAPPQPQQMSELQGVLKIHPKFVYKYYLQFGDGQTCALYSPHLKRDIPAFHPLKSGAIVNVRGVLGTYQTTGSTPDNPSPFPKTWVLYMDVYELDIIRK